MKQKHIAIVLLLAILAPLVTSNLAFAQQYGNTPTQTGSTLEENLKLAREKIQMVQQHPATGSGTPVLGPNGIVTAMVFVGAVFGGIFIFCVLYAKHVVKQKNQNVTR